MSSRPPVEVLRAFGVADQLVQPLPGGQGSSWRAGPVVLKPEGGPVHEWLAGALADVVPDGFRLAAPLPSSDGWVSRGWSATRWVAGDEPDRSQPATWAAIVEAGRAFHRAVAHLDRPSCLDARTDAWALADRAAWGERPLHVVAELVEVTERLRRASGPLGPPQLVHGDLTGNVLFAGGEDPAVIDIAPYWRSRAYAEGVVLADALCWHDASPDVLAQAGVPVSAVARALLFRAATASERAASGVVVDLPDETRRYERATTAIGL